MTPVHGRIGPGEAQPGTRAGLGRRRSTLVVAAVSALAAVVWTAAVASGRLARIDQAVFDAVAAFRTEAGVGYMILISYLGSEYLMPLFLLAVGLAVGRRSPRWGWFISVVAISANVWQLALKNLLFISRPPPLLPYWQKAGYPSGHTLVGLCFAWSVLLYLRRRPGGGDRRWWSVVRAWLMFWPLVVGWSRVYIAAHWISDVVGALLLGVMHLSAAWWIYGAKLE